MADIIQITKPEPLILVCGKCHNKSFFVYADVDEIECVQCGAKNLQHMKFVTETVVKTPEETDSDTASTTFFNFNAIVFLNKLVSEAKIDVKDDFLALGALSRSGNIQVWRHTDVLDTVNEKVHRSWLKMRLKQMVALLLAP